MVNVYVITSIYAFEEAEKLTEAMVGVDARTRPGVNASHESELMVGADAWTKPAINAFHNAMLIPINVRPGAMSLLLRSRRQN
jgi:hypothetical protein